MYKTLIRASFGALAIMLIASTASANLLTNPGFEDPSAAPGVEYAGATGWTDFGGVFTITEAVLGSAGAHTGEQALKVFGGIAGVYQEFGASEGELWGGSVWALNDSVDLMTGGQVAAINIEWHGAGGFIEATFGETIDAGSTLDAWTQLTVMGMAPAGTTMARLVLLTGNFGGDPAGGAPRFDDASFGVVPIPGAALLLGSGLFGLLGFARRKT